MMNRGNILVLLAALLVGCTQPTSDSAPKTPDATAGVPTLNPSVRFLESLRANGFQTEEMFTEDLGPDYSLEETSKFVGVVEPTAVMSFKERPGKLRVVTLVFNKLGGTTFSERRLDLVEAVTALAMEIPRSEARLKVVDVFNRAHDEQLSAEFPTAKFSTPRATLQVQLLRATGFRIDITLNEK